MKLNGTNGYSISCREKVPEDSKLIIIAMHGFCGDKESGCIGLLEKEVYKMGIGLITFDWPAHGESETDGYHLTITNCLNDLEVVIENTKEKYPCAELMAFSTSFGGYLTLLYNHYHKDIFSKIILRSPAIKMHNVIKGKIIEKKEMAELQEKGFFVYGFDREIIITKDFIDEIDNNRIESLYGDAYLEKISIIHGTSDDLVPFSDSFEFAKKHHCSIYPVTGADHRYKKTGELDRVIDIAIKVLVDE